MVDDHLLFHSWRGLTSAEEERLIARWRSADAANDQHYHELGRVLEAVRAAHPFPPSQPPGVIDILEEAASRERGTSGRRRWAGPWIAIGTAAAIVAAVVWGARELPTAPLTVNELETAAGETTTVGLSDGTVVRLAPSSRIRLRPNGVEREVELAGRAFFAVAKAAGQPFRVRTQAGDVVVLGTRFDVTAREKDLRAVVVEGKVAISTASGGETRVSAGQTSRVVAGRLLPTVATADVDKETGWVGRFLAFQNTPLRQVGREIERVYGVNVVVDSAIAERTVTTWLADRSLDEVLRIVCAVSVASCSKRNGTITILGQ